ncbi:MAG TPA: NAD(P)H-hydrate dehydratase [Flavobacteriaceae bacterium]|nr:NAD(P)H-hydrate dehydratase [Flavobacteriaceae bacterium]
MKIFTKKQLKEADRITLKKQQISSLELMERAATLVFNEIHASLQGVDTEIKIFCGVGNNGGDGLVVARLLKEQKYRVKTFVVNYSDKRSEEFLHNYERIKEMDHDWPELLTENSDLPYISKNDFVIDAIFGIGLNRSMADWVNQLIEHINSSQAFVLSIDLPSGLFLDKAVSKKGHIIKSSVTLTFQTPKLVFFLPETAGYVGNFHVLDIGLDRQYLLETETEAKLIAKEEAKPLYHPREKFSHKGTYGHSLIIGGSCGKMGSVVLASKGAFRAGAGKVTALVPKCGYEILQTALPEAMVITSESEKYLKSTNFDFEPEAICFGVGAGKKTETVDAFREFLKKTKKPMVIDADGLNILSENPEFFNEIPKNSILTPHPKELERMLGKWENDFEKLEKAKAFSQKHNLIIVIKGAYTITVEAEKLFVNNNGNPGMATAGSGDVLAGLLTGLLAQGYDSLTAAVFGVYLHGNAGDFAAAKHGMDSLIAGDILENMGNAYLDLFKKPPVPKENKA